MQPRQKENNRELQEMITTLLFEGYSLYPYRSTAPKNTTPIPFGVIYPKTYCRHNKSLNDTIRTECLLKGSGETELSVTIKFLQVRNKNEGWETAERVIELPPSKINELASTQVGLPFRFSTKGKNSFETIDGNASLSVMRMPENGNIFLTTVSIENRTPVHSDVSGHEILRYAFVSTHTILQCVNGEFISKQAPGEEYRDMSAKCQNLHTYPVLIGEDNTTMLSSSIILYDHPQINRSSKGDLFDGTEMEEALWLHLNALTEQEQEQLMTADDKVRAMMERAKQLTPSEFMHLHDHLKNKE